MDALLSALIGETPPTERLVLCTVVESSGSVPQRAGARLVLAASGRMAGTIGGGAVEARALDAARELLVTGGERLVTLHLTRDLGMCCGGSLTLFLQTLEPAESLYLFGAGHVAKPLAARASELGFRVEVIDERPEWANRERFPAAAVLRVDDPAAVARELRPDARSSICVLTHDHRLDQEIVERCLGYDLRYLGVIGSRRKAELFRQRLLAKGFAAAAVGRLRCPMGVAIGAQTPEEIAISIAGELVQERRTAAASRSPVRIVHGAS
ncbi:MAG: xanthine dehydrogenase accessory protein XdhC [Deltaproteobacteria bacterium]